MNLRQTWLLAFALVLPSCTAVPTEPSYEVTAADLQKAAHHEYDGIYKGSAMQSPGAICGTGYVPAQWVAVMDVTGDRFHLKNYTFVPERRGNVSPGGVLTRYKVYVGRISAGLFKGVIDLGSGCKATLDLHREIAE